MVQICAFLFNLEKLNKLLESRLTWQSDYFFKYAAYVLPTIPIMYLELEFKIGTKFDLYEVRGD